MPEQAGVPMSGYLLIHDHSGPGMGGVLSPTITGLAYRAMTGLLATVVNANSTMRSTGSTVYVKLKEMRVTVAQLGSVTVTYDAYVSGGTGYYSIRKNGVQVDEQTEVSLTPIGHTYTLAGPFYVGDLIQIYCKRVGGATVYVETMQLEYGWRIEYFGDGSSHVLSSPLALTDTSTWPTVNQDP